MKTLNSVSPQFHGVSGEWQVHHNGPPSTRYKTGGPAPSDMDRSMLRQAGTRRTSQRARRSAFTVTWTSTPDPVDIAGLGMEDRTPARTEHQRPMCKIVTWTAGRTRSIIPLTWVTQLVTMIFWDVTAYFYTGIHLGLRRFNTNEVVWKGCWWRAVNVRAWVLPRRNFKTRAHMGTRRAIYYSVTLRRVRAVSIAYSESVFVALGIQHAKRKRYIVICGLFSSTILFHIIS